MENKIYYIVGHTVGDSIIFVLKEFETYLIVVNYSFSHNIYNVITLTKQDFKDYYEPSETDDYDYYFENYFEDIPFERIS